MGKSTAGPVEVGIMWSTFTKTYDTHFESFIRGTVKSQGYSVVGFFKVAKLGWEYETGIYWGGVINKYSGHDILLPTHRIKKHLLCDYDVIWPIKPLLYYQDGVDYPIRLWNHHRPMQPKYYLKRHLFITQLTYTKKHYFM